MIRVIVRTDDASMAANVGGAVHSAFKTFEIEAPELEQFLMLGTGDYWQRQVIGVELIQGKAQETQTAPSDIAALKTMLRKAREALMLIDDQAQHAYRSASPLQGLLDDMSTVHGQAMQHAGADLIDEGWDFDADEVELRPTHEVRAALKGHETPEQIGARLEAEHQEMMSWTREVDAELVANTEPGYLEKYMGPIEEKGSSK